MTRRSSSASHIYLENSHKKYRIKTAALAATIEDILRFLKIKKACLEFIFLDDRRIKKLNKKFMRRSSATDVLSFDLDGCGSIAISLDRAAWNSKVFGTDMQEEIILYVIHGILHLSGYDDGCARDKKCMKRKESEILEHVCTREILSKVLTRR